MEKALSLFARCAALLVMATLLSWPAPARADTLTVVTEAWPPHVFEQDGRPTGVDYDVVRAVLSELGHEIEVVFLPWKRCLDMVAHGEADAILDAGWSPERELEMLFPQEPLKISRTVLFHRKDTPFEFDTFDDLRGLVVGTQLGYHYSDEFERAEGVAREPVVSVEINVDKLLHDRIDLFMANRCFGLYTARRMGVLDRIGHAAKPVSSGEVYLAFTRQRDYSALAEAFSQALRRFKTTEAYQKIFAEYGLTP